MAHLFSRNRITAHVAYDLPYWAHATDHQIDSHGKSLNIRPLVRDINIEQKFSGLGYDTDTNTTVVTSRL